MSKPTATEVDELVTSLESTGRVPAGVELVQASSLAITRPEFTWEPRIPANAVSLLVGLEGFGKTLIAFHIMARLSRGQLEGDRRGRPGDAVYVGLEDDWASISVPRLMAAGANLDRVHFVRLSAGGIFSVEADLPALTSALERLDEVAMIVVDPLDAHLGDGIDSHRKSEVQRAVQHLAEVAQGHRCSILGIGHLQQERAEQRPTHEGDRVQRVHH